MPAALLAIVLAVAAPAQVVVDDVAQSLRSDPVYVDPDAERALSDAEADQLRDQIRAAGAPVFIAVLPEAAGEPDAVVQDVIGATARTGAYAVVVGDSFVGRPGAAATSAINAERDNGTLAVLESFVSRVAGGDGSTSGGSDGSDGSSDGGGGTSWLPLALLGAGGVGLYSLSSRRRRRDRRAEQAEFDADVQLLRAELSVVSEDVMRLEPEVTVNPDARQDYEAAVTRFRAASAALDYADEPVDLVRVDRVVSEARYAMARARAIVGGYPPPPPPTELRQPGRHGEPPLDVDGDRQLVYGGGMPFYGGGWFGGGGGGLFSGLLLGSMLGGGWGFGGWGGTTVVHDDYGDGGGGGGFGDGGFGGGGFGGGDFGGGDF